MLSNVADSPQLAIIKAFNRIGDGKIMRPCPLFTDDFFWLTYFFRPEKETLLSAG
jgi:hypothetical protein